MRFVLAGSFMLLCVGCATQSAQHARKERIGHVDQRMLFPGAAAGVASKVASYEMQPQERFRMPQPLDATPPRLSDDSPRMTLAPTTACVLVIVGERGDVERVDALDDRDDCHAGVAVENADLMRAVQSALAQWKFAPAAVCTYAAATRPPQEIDDCAGAEKVESVPVSLMYAFTFEVREGRATVREDQVAGH